MCLAAEVAAHGHAIKGVKKWNPSNRGTGQLSVSLFSFAFPIFTMKLVQNINLAETGQTSQAVFSTGLHEM
jgi:phage replication-related protein YjqB (UPF0714/DUF867 family)